MPKNAWLWIAIIWTLMIAVLCMVRLSDLPNIGVKGTDKYVHATFHFFFTMFWCKHLMQSKRLPLQRILIRMLSVSIAYGCLIEVAQEEFTATRHADIQDVAANFVGAALAVLLLIILERRKKKLQQ